MTQVRTVVDSSMISDIFDLPPAFLNRKVEVIMFPVEEKAETTQKFTMTQINEWSKSPKVQAIVGVLKDINLPVDLNMKDIKQIRLSEKYQI